MKQVKEYLGKVSLTVEGYWKRDKDYDRLCLVGVEDKNKNIHTYISKKIVPGGTELTNTNYWMPTGFSGNQDIDVISKQFINSLFDSDTDLNFIQNLDEWGDIKTDLVFSQLIKEQHD